MYTVTRQSQWPDGGQVVEVSAGGIDYCNPDALSAKYKGEFQEFDDPREAVATAIEIARAWRKDTRKRISVGVGATGGMTMPFDGGTFAEARKWAEERYATLEKCGGCGGIMPDSKRDRWHADDWSGEEFCSERCATREAEYQAEEQAKLDAEVNE